MKSIVGLVLSLVVSASLALPCNAEPIPKIYWVRRGSEQAVMRANYDGTETETLVSTSSQVDTPSGLAIDTAGGKLYWGNPGNASIMRSNLDGTGVQEIVTSGVGLPGAIALDVSAGWMYWTDANLNTISRANLDGGNRQVLLSFSTGGIQHPVGIELDVLAGKMYWADLVSVRRANLDGSNVEVLTTHESAYLSALDLDLTNNKMYWSNQVTGFIWRANLDGTGVEELMRRGARDIVVDAANDALYFSEGNDIFRSRINGNNVRPIVQGPGFIPSFAFDSLPLPAPLPPGDYNRDGTVDAADYNVWRDNVGEIVPPGTGADFNENGFIENAEYFPWRNHFGQSSITGAGGAQTAASVPEPASLLVVVLTLLGCATSSPGGWQRILRS